MDNTDKEEHCDCFCPCTVVVESTNTICNDCKNQNHLDWYGIRENEKDSGNSVTISDTNVHTLNNKED